MRYDIGFRQTKFGCANCNRLVRKLYAWTISRMSKTELHKSKRKYRSDKSRPPVCRICFMGRYGIKPSRNHQVKPSLESYTLPNED